MKYLLDTCVISELIKPQPDSKVMEWIASKNEDDLFISVLSFGEIRRGISYLENNKRKSKLIEWYIELDGRFKERTIPVDLKVAEEWDGIQGELDKIGKSLPVIDGFLAATALIHNLVVVTRNERDFHLHGIEIINPWK